MVTSLGHGGATVAPRSELMDLYVRSILIRYGPRTLGPFDPVEDHSARPQDGGQILAQFPVCLTVTRV
jgi:hypothetical protein